MQDSDPFPYLSNLVRFQEEEQDFRTWTMDLELMHYYDTVSWRTMPRHDEMEDIWRLQLPRIAFSHDYLMHQLLAISAAHLTYLYRTDQDRRTAYALRATQHQNKALQRLQVALPNIDDDNCPALFLTASLLSIGAFAALSESATQRAASKPGIEELLHVLLLLKGMHGILNGHYGTLKASPIAKLIEAGERGSSSPLLAEIMKELTDLGVGPSMRSQSGSGDRREAEGGPAKSDVLREARDSFVYWIRHAVDTVELPELRVLMTWPTRLTDGFMTLLRARDADALAVLACYGRILESMGSSHWYLGGWGECILADIDRGP